MKNGLYKVEFSTPLNSGTGVVVAHDGEFRGGDDTIYYTGEYTEDGTSIKASLNTGRHAAHGQSVFSIDAVSIELSGSTSDTSAKMSGNHSGVNFSATLNWICE